jgi:hypothetical protein
MPALSVRTSLVVAALFGALLGLGACGAAGPETTAAGPTAAGSPVSGAGTASATRATATQARPQVVEPTAGAQPPSTQAPTDPVGDPTAHAPSLTEVKRELRLELVAVRATNATYIDPLRYVTVWERTDQGVDANMPVGAPILAPCPIKILDIEPGWYAGQPLVYFELLAGPDAGKVQYVAEQITDIAPPGTFLQQGQAIARYAPSGTGIEYGWSTLSGVTLAVATGGYEEGQITPAGRLIRAWLNALGAGAGPDT